MRTPPLSSKADGRRFILRLDRELERFDRSILVADWNLFTGRSTAGADAWQLRRARFLSDPDLLEWVRSARDRDWPPLLARRLELLERVLLDAQVEQNPEVVALRGELQRRIVAFRPEWKGRRVGRMVLHRVLRESPNAADRRRAFYALEPLQRPLEEPLQRLVLLRNERARQAGFRTFADMRLSFSGLTSDRLLELVDEAVVPASSRLRRLREEFVRGGGKSGWHPWDALYAKHRRAPLPARSFPREGMLARVMHAVGRWGFPVERMRFRVVFHDTPSGGLTLAPNPPRDVRILVHPTGGWLAHLVMFHEVGHAVHSASIRAPRHLLRWHENIPGFGPFHEGIGGMFEEIASLPSWLAEQPGISRVLAEQFASASQDGNVLDAAWHATWLRTEQLLYRQPDRDPMPEVHRYERRLFGYDDYPSLSFVDSFFVESPIYAPNYLLAILFGHQLRERILQLFGDPLWPNPRLGPWLRRWWFAPGSTFDWGARLRETTGHPFSARAFRAAYQN